MKNTYLACLKRFLEMLRFGSEESGPEHNSDLPSAQMMIRKGDKKKEEKNSKSGLHSSL